MMPRVSNFQRNRSIIGLGKMNSKPGLSSLKLSPPPLIKPPGPDLNILRSGTLIDFFGATRVEIAVKVAASNYSRFEGNVCLLQ